MDAKETIKNWINTKLCVYKKSNGLYTFTKAALIEILMTRPDPEDISISFISTDKAKFIHILRYDRDYQYIEIARTFHRNFPTIYLPYGVSEHTGLLLVEIANKVMSGKNKVPT